jgi:hypothetical protein
MLLSKPVEMPVMAVPMSVTATMPMITPNAVSIERTLFACIWNAAIFQLSVSS